MITCKAWRGDDLRGEWQALRKLDGVRALVVHDKPRGLHRWRVLSRHGKPLYNLTHLVSYFTDAEVWLGSFKATIQAVRTQAPVRVPRSAIYQLNPPDRRLSLGTVQNPTAAHIRHLLRKFKRAGEDGLVLRQGERWLKVKHEATYDVKVTGVQPGKGRHRGRMGALLTPRGKVGTGFSDDDRELQSAPYEKKGSFYVGKTIEVACAALTADGKFRHARFVRVREDK